ncbi:MAG: HAD family hydrolase [Chloroflexi bacterium HGW-Chloroflexi-10]|nr:MAG: HAD family hydrolase [Chloroflexi bacterium HGW-Chloroflexi-10]
MIKAILFDLDGLLIDSEGSWHQSRIQIFKEAGKIWDLEDHKAVVGTSTNHWANYMAKRLGGNMSVAQLQTLTIGKMEAIYRRSIPFLPGAVQVVQFASAHYPTGLASGSPHQLIDLVTSEPRLKDCFQVIVSADEVAAGKPAPDVYLEAARRMGIEPQACVCFEDSANGIRAGKAAGMKVIAVPDARYGSPADEVLAMADVVLNSLTEFSADTLQLLG